MTWLFDINVLLAIADPNHTFHHTIHQWIDGRSGDRWASCPLTENGFVRILSQSAYRGGARTPAAAIAVLRDMKSSPGWEHEFWPDDRSLTDPAHFVSKLLAGSRQITDAYLVSLAVTHRARLVTFDRNIAWHAVPNATRDTLLIPLASD